MSDDDLVLTPAEKTLVLQQRAFRAAQREEARCRVRALSEAARFAQWLYDHGDWRASFSVFVDEYGFTPEAGESASRLYYHIEKVFRVVEIL